MSSPGPSGTDPYGIRPSGHQTGSLIARLCGVLRLEGEYIGVIRAVSFWRKIRREDEREGESMGQTEDPKMR